MAGFSRFLALLRPARAASNIPTRAILRKRTRTPELSALAAISRVILTAEIHLICERARATPAMADEPPRTPERPPRTPPGAPPPRAADPRELERMRQRVRELEEEKGELERTKGDLERENHLIKALLPPLSPAAQALISLAAGTPGGLSSGACAGTLRTSAGERM